ncbi:hypothetical protein ACIBCT_35415 [Streptosporangium sp. NPDC050855]|uniref:hypothetical protein n=1 Tax=Streptosporangium sp. NPDC050855 TaxID=3366194 RepID=UPI0037B55B64
MTEQPEQRIIESVSRKEDVSEEDAKRILEAIYSGSQLRCETLRKSGYAFGDDVRKEVCVTSFVCPILQTPRVAVECWSGTNKWTRDFANQEAADAYADNEMVRLGI